MNWTCATAWCVWLLLINASTAQVVGRRIEKALPPPTPATYEERNALVSPLKPCEIDSLVLPYIRWVAEAPPRRVAAGEPAWKLSSDGEGDHAGIIWRVIPWREEHAEFLKRYAEINAAEHAALEREKLIVKLAVEYRRPETADCAEFLYRDAIYRRGRQSDNALPRTLLESWKKLAAVRYSPFTFPLPLEGRWHVLVDLTRHHQRRHECAFALDFVAEDGGSTFRGANIKENHFAWNQSLLAVCDGVIVNLVDEFEDHEIGRPAARSKANQLLLDCGGGVYAQYAHLRQGSATVKKGERVRAGQVLARVGNSGASGAPHLHFCYTDADGFSLPGRYLCRVFASQGWTEIEGETIDEGWHITSIP